MARNNIADIKDYKRKGNINIGIIIFGMIFLYLLAFGIFRFIKNGNVSSYIVNDGTLSDNVTYEAFAIRSEKLFNASKGGELQLFARECEKVGYGDTVYTIDETGALKSALASLAAGQTTLSDEDFKYLQNQIQSFKSSYSPVNFQMVYDFKLSMDADILDALNLYALGSNDIDISRFLISQATTPGIVVYNYDGYEDVTVDSFTKDMLNARNYKKTSTRGAKEIKSGDPVYKVITGENWNLVMEIDDGLASKLDGQKSIQIRFVDDSEFAWVNFKVLDREDGKFLVLDLPNSAIRYARDRFVKIEVQTSDTKGLKVPKSAIVSKNLYKIPKEYLTEGQSNGNDGFLKLVSGGSNPQAEFVDARIIKSDDDYCYVDTSSFESGIQLIKQGKAGETYTVGDTDTCYGVYNINKGYAIFVSVSIKEENNEYCIVESNSKYGVKKYDYIALDGKSVTEDEIIR